MTTSNMPDWDAIYEAMRDAGLRPVRKGWKYRYKAAGPAIVYTDNANKPTVEEILESFDGIKVIQISQRVTVQQRFDELSDDILLL